MFRRSTRDDASKLSRQQKDMLKQFMKSTGLSEKAAMATLKDTSWDLKLALHRVQDPLTLSSAANTPSQTDRLSDLFNRYKDADSDMILADGIMRFCEDLQVPPEDISLLVFSWHCNATAMCEFSKDQFISGFRSLRVTSVEKLRDQLPRLRVQMEEEATAREIYGFAFNWGKEKGQKWLCLETAVGLWQLIFGFRKWPLVDQWCDFVQERHKKSISKDTWTQLFEFARMPVASLASYDEEAAWPTLIDDFVLYLQEQGQLPDGKH